MQKNGNTIFNFIKWISKKYIQLEHGTLPNPCKIIGLINKNQKQLAQVQFAGQSHILEIEPHKIVEQDLFEYFSSKDKKLIFYLTYNKEKLLLTDKYQCKESYQEMVVLTEIVTGNKMTVSADALSANTNLISQLSPKDANRIGFISGMNYIKKCFSHLIKSTQQDDPIQK